MEESCDYLQCEKRIEVMEGETGPYSKPAVTQSILLGSCNSPQRIEIGEAGTQLRGGQKTLHQ